MFPPFPENPAKQILVRVLNLLDEKKLRLKQVTKPSEERKNSPVMIGALVCVDKNQNEINLIAASGISKQLEFCDENDEKFHADFDTLNQRANLVIVPPVVSAEKIEDALSKNDEEIHKITELLKKEHVILNAHSVILSVSEESRDNVILNGREESHDNDILNASEESHEEMFRSAQHDAHVILSRCEESHSNVILNEREESHDNVILNVSEESHEEMFRSAQHDVKIASLNMTASALKSKRAELCNESLEKVESLYKFSCADGKSRSLKEMCMARNKGKFPPTGTGDCAEPKLLNYAFSHGLTPVSLAETKLGNRNQEREIRLVPPCDSRCKIILPEILGLEILYQDSSIVVVNKQSGLLSVPGRGEDKFDSIETRLRRLFPQCIKQPAVHRLDMETSGIMVLALTKEAHRKMNMSFEAREVKKEYTALLDGVLAKKGIASEGEMTLYFRLDVENRPHQIWDAENGKKSITKWKILDVERYKSPDGKTRNATRVLFTPLTGRTHQLRLASADKHGFGVPIIGDTLYGHCDKGERLMLHASKIEFTHPETGEKMIFESKPEF